MALSPTVSRFVLHWGEMGTRWGVNRTVSQIHALLYITGRPMHADEIVDTLEVARSNVSTSLRELQGWGLVRLVHLSGDRRDHYETVGSRLGVNAHYRQESASGGRSIRRSACCSSSSPTRPCARSRPP